MATSIRQTETDRNTQKQTCFQTWPLYMGSCKQHIIDEREPEIERERERETESKTERHTYGERNRDKAQEREGETQRGKDRQVSSTPGRRYQAHLVEATRKSPRSSKTVMKRTASLRFAALAPQ